MCGLHNTCTVSRLHVSQRATRPNGIDRFVAHCSIASPPGPFPVFDSSFLRVDFRSTKTCTRKKNRIYLNCTLNSSSMSSSSQLSSHNLLPPDFAAPGGAPPRCARSVCESSQSVVKTPVRRSGFAVIFGDWRRTCYRKLLKFVVLLECAKMGSCSFVLFSLIGLFWIGCGGCCWFGRHGDASVVSVGTLSDRNAPGRAVSSPPSTEDAAVPVN